MEFGVFTFIIPDTIFNSIIKYMDYELTPDENTQILFTYDTEPGVVKELDRKPDPEMIKNIITSNRRFFPSIFDFKTEKGLRLFIQDEPVVSEVTGRYTVKSLETIFNKHIHWTNYIASIYNGVYYTNDPTKKIAVSILKIGSNRYLFAYQPKYLNKTDFENMVYSLFINTY